MNRKILIVEDESSIRGFIKINFERNNFKVIEANSGEEGIEKARKYKPNIIILDVMLPGIDGFKVCEILRGEFKEVGIIMLTARSQDMDKIMGLEYGADDYIIKPFNPMELLARVNALLRRIDLKKTDASNTILSGAFKIDLEGKRAFKNTQELELTPKEFTLLKIFMGNKGKAFSRDEILNLVWGYDFSSDTKIVDVNIRRLREKIEDVASKPIFIETVWGIGYRWRNDA